MGGCGVGEMEGGVVNREGGRGVQKDWGREGGGGFRIDATKYPHSASRRKFGSGVLVCLGPFCGMLPIASLGLKCPWQRADDRQQVRNM